jgi:hypothetical protein
LTFNCFIFGCAFFFSLLFSRSSIFLCFSGSSISLIRSFSSLFFFSLSSAALSVFYCMDKVKRYKLSREAKNKADKNRTKVAENHWRSIHAVKAERAAEEREKKKRELKERIREIEDPEKQRKMEERENRREKKKAQPKMKQLKVN